MTDKEDADKKKLGLAGSIVDKTEIKITIKKQPFFKTWLEWSRKNNINKEWTQAFEEGGEPK